MQGISNILDLKFFLNFFAKNQIKVNSNISIIFDFISADLIIKCSERAPQSSRSSYHYLKNNLHLEIYRCTVYMHLLELNKLKKQNHLNEDSLIKVRGITGIKFGELNIYLLKMLDLVKKCKLLDLVNSEPYRHLDIDIRALKLLNQTLSFFELKKNKDQTLFLASKNPLINFSVTDLETAIDFLLDHHKCYDHKFVFYPHNISEWESPNKKSKQELMTGEEIVKAINLNNKEDQEDQEDKDVFDLPNSSSLVF